jgi:hypothetical protein
MGNLKFKKPAPTMAQVGKQNAHHVVKLVFTTTFIKEVRSLTPERNQIAIEARERIVIILYM